MSRLQQWMDAKFGLFIHWGPYALAGQEASWPIMQPQRWKDAISQEDYERLPERFDPVQFDAAEWIELARRAGQRYVVMTSKHHDGFCMFDSAFTHYKVTNTPFRRDVCKELADAAAAVSVPLGFYYSPPDMHHRGFRDTSKPASENWLGESTRPEWFSYLDYMQAQLGELLTRYGDVSTIWFDGTFHQERYDPLRFHRWLRANFPDVLLNDRLGGNHVGDGFPPAAGKLLPREVWGDYTTREQSIPDELAPDGPWEACLTINGTWAYNPNDTRFKSTTELIHALILVASKGGNLLLNVGPTPEGTIQRECTERLLGIGAWLRRNGAAIYGTTRGPLPPAAWGRTTAKGSTTYLHVTAWPDDNVLRVEGIRGRVAEVVPLAPQHLVASEGSQHFLAPGVGLPRRLDVEQSSGVLTVKLPLEIRDEHATVLRVERA